MNIKLKQNGSPGDLALIMACPLFKDIIPGMNMQKAPFPSMDINIINGSF